MRAYLELEGEVPAGKRAPGELPSALTPAGDRSGRCQPAMAPVSRLVPGPLPPPWLPGCAPPPEAE